MEHWLPLAELERLHRVTWGELADLEPRLYQLLWRAGEAGAACRCRSDVDSAFTPLSNEISGLIGFPGANRGHPVLGSVRAYEVVARKVYDTVASLVRAPGGPAADISPETRVR
jgi:hypothetical protein